MLSKVHPADQRAQIRALVEEVENIRRERQASNRSRKHPTAKRFTQEELRDQVCPSYHHLLLGATQRLPSRTTVLQIATYLECSHDETNALLIASEYLPQQVIFPVDVEQGILEVARGMLKTLPVPGVVLTRGWRLDTANDLFCAIHDLPSLNQLPQEKRTALHYLFDPNLPFYRLLAADRVVWRDNVRHVLPRLRVPSEIQHELPYQETLMSVRKLPDFQMYWERDELTMIPSLSAPCLRILTPHTSFSQLQIGVLTLSPLYHPSIIFGIPFDTAAYHAPASTGVPVLENRWL